MPKLSFSPLHNPAFASVTATVIPVAILLVINLIALKYTFYCFEKVSSPRTPWVISVHRSLGSMEFVWYFLSTLQFPWWTNHQASWEARALLSLFLSVSMNNTDAYMALFLKVQVWEQERKSLKLSLLCVLTSHYTVPFLKIQGKPNFPAPSKKHVNKVFKKAPCLRDEKRGILYNWESHII